MNGSAKTRVAVNGYGVIGKRVAEAIVRRDELELAGMSDIGTDWRPAEIVCLTRKAWISGM